MVLIVVYLANNLNEPRQPLAIQPRTPGPTTQEVTTQKVAPDPVIPAPAIPVPGFNASEKVILKDMTRILQIIRHGYKEAEEGCWTCVVYDLTADIRDLDYPCVKMHVPPQPTICLYPDERDQVMSRTFYVNATWEGALLEEVKSWLRASPDIGFIDIGANLGPYTLPIAAMGHRVVAVEPNIESVRRLHKAVALSNLGDRVTLLANAVSNQHLPTKLLRYHNNQAAVKSETTAKDPTYNFETDDFAKSIHLNDLLPFCNFSVAILKIDIVGFEHRALRRADILFDNVYIPYVQMEWYQVSRLGMNAEDDENFDMFMYMLHFFARRHYVPRIPIQGTKLSLKDWTDWPLDVVWTKSYL